MSNEYQYTPTDWKLTSKPQEQKTLHDSIINTVSSQKLIDGLD